MKPKDLDKMTKPELVRLVKTLQKQVAKLEKASSAVNPELHSVAFPWSASLPNAFEGRN